MPEYTNISIKKEFADRIVKLIEANPDLGFRSIAQFLEDAARRRLEKLEAQKRVMEHFNMYEDHITIRDHKVGQYIDIYAKNGVLWCEYCESNNCEHIQFASSVPEIKRALKKKGWKVED